MQLSQKYELERMELKDKIFEYKERIAKLHEMEQNKDDFIKAIRKFMEMQTLTAPMLRELIDHIDVFEKEGSSKLYTQRIAIYYRFVGYIEIPTEPDYKKYTADTRQGVKVEYIPTEMFPTQHGKSAWWWKAKEIAQREKKQEQTEICSCIGDKHKENEC